MHFVNSLYIFGLDVARPSLPSPQKHTIWHVWSREDICRPCHIPPCPMMQRLLMVTGNSCTRCLSLLSIYKCPLPTVPAKHRMCFATLHVRDIPPPTVMKREHSMKTVLDPMGRPTCDPGMATGPWLGYHTLRLSLGESTTFFPPMKPGVARQLSLEMAEFPHHCGSE